MNTLNLDVHYLLHIGMNGPNVNKSFESKLIDDLKKRGSIAVLSFGSCNLHIVNNAFRKGFEKLSEYSEIDLDHYFAVDLYFFFKFSAARREDYEKMSDITDVCAKYKLKHSTTRRLKE